MGAWKEALRTDEKVGSVDLATLALPEGDFDRPESIGFLTRDGIWYNLKPLAETALRDDLIYPVFLECRGSSGPGENIFDTIGMGLSYIKKWVTEARHFPRDGNVSLLNQVVREWDQLTINGRKTGHLDIAWVTERCNREAGEKPGSGYGRTLPDGEKDIVWLKPTRANF